MATVETETLMAKPRPLSGLVQGDARRLPFRTGSVQTAVTSVPFWGLRDYGTARWEGGDADCRHAIDGRHGPKQTGQAQSGHAARSDRLDRDACATCGARRVDRQIGLEPHPDDYVRSIVAACDEVWRLLRADGTFWLNIGDTYVTKPIGGASTHDPKYPGGRNRKEGLRANRTNCPAQLGLKHKDLALIPARLSLALQAAGWYVRCDIVQDKANGMCESAKDRPTRTHEYLYLLTKRPRYYYDRYAILEPATGNAHSRGNGINPKAKQAGRNSRANVDRDVRHAHVQRSRQNESFSAAAREVVPVRNKRAVWRIASSSFKGAHFATMNPQVVENCILAGTSEAGCCSACGKCWRRIVERPKLPRNGEVQTNRRDGGLTAEDSIERTGLSHFKYDQWLRANGPRTVGWEPACSCDAGEPVPCLVADCFSGAGTTGLVAARLGRRYVGLDLKHEYLTMSRERIDQSLVAPPAKRRRQPRPATDQLSLFPE